MRVYNLTDKPLDYRGKLISPVGGYVDLPDMTFVPDRDKELAMKRVLAFGQLPAWFETHLKLRRVTELAEKLVNSPAPRATRRKKA